MHYTKNNSKIGFAVPKMRDPGELKTPFSVALSPRQTTYAMREAKRLQITVAELVRRLIDRELDRNERQRPLERVDFRA